MTCTTAIQLCLMINVRTKMCLSGLVKNVFDLFFYKMRTSRKVRVTLLWLGAWNSKIFLWGITVCLRIEPCQWTPHEPVSAAWTDYTSTAKEDLVILVWRICPTSAALHGFWQIRQSCPMLPSLGSDWAPVEHMPQKRPLKLVFFCSRLFAMKDYLTLLYLISKRWEIIPTFIWKSNACA